MVKESMDLLELLRKRGLDGDVTHLSMREATNGVLMACDNGTPRCRLWIGAEHDAERSPDRLTHRNGYGSPRVGRGSALRASHTEAQGREPTSRVYRSRRRSEKALQAVIQQAYVEGVSTRRVDDLVKALGCEGISRDSR